MNQGLLHDLLTRGVDEDGELRDSDQHPERFKDSPLGRIPREWEVRTLSDVAVGLTDGTHQAVQISSQDGSGIPFL